MVTPSLPPFALGMLCSVCHRQLGRTDARCRACGTPCDGRHHLDLVLPAGERVPLDRSLTLGRAPASDLRLEDPSVSRSHAQIDADHDGWSLRDAGSSFGTFVDGRRLEGAVPLTAGMKIALGDCELTVQERLDRAAAGLTMSVPAGISVVVEIPPGLAAETAGRGAAVAAAQRFSPARRARLDGHDARRPRLRSGYSLKRLDAADSVNADDRYVLKDHASGALMRLGEQEAEIARRLDGTRDLVDLVAEASARLGPDGPARLATLLAELADRGLLAGVRAPSLPEAKKGWLARAFTPHERNLPRVPGAIAAVYRRGGFLLFTRAALALIALIALAGLAAFVTVVVGRYGTPFVVAKRVGIGALVFVLGRLLIVVCHEFAHGLTAESFGRPVTRAGLKLALIFPYVFVDTTDAWFESRQRRMAISLAGPISDLTIGGAFAIGCLLAPAGNVRDVLFQVAFAGYIGALFNINPVLERDGYHVLVDLLHEPGLKRRATQRISERLSGHPDAGGGGRLFWYGVASLIWSTVMVAFAVVMSLRYYHRLAAVAPPALVWTVLSAFYLLLALPLAVQLLRPLWTRAGRPRPA
jgi:putative peptide zinc metalloprotease protein